jgi:hypothetical protein
MQYNKDILQAFNEMLMTEAKWRESRRSTAPILGKEEIIRFLKELKNDSHEPFQVSGQRYGDRIEYVTDMLDELSSEGNEISIYDLLDPKTQSITTGAVTKLLDWIKNTEDPRYTEQRLFDDDPGWDVDNDELNEPEEDDGV